MGALFTDQRDTECSVGFALVTVVHFEQEASRARSQISSVEETAVTWLNSPEYLSYLRRLYPVAVERGTPMPLHRLLCRRGCNMPPVVAGLNTRLVQSIPWSLGAGFNSRDLIYRIHYFVCSTSSVEYIELYIV